jgi:acetylornithine deacetylase/succinyl-diaminopimelate desuccinylase-like protein
MGPVGKLRQPGGIKYRDLHRLELGGKGVDLGGKRLFILAFTLTAAATAAALVRAPGPSPSETLSREILAELVEIDTTDATGDNTEAARAMATRLRQAGFPERDVIVVEPHSGKGNLVARLRGTGAKPPILLLAHLDVVEARREDWSSDPFTFVQRGGYFYGRGTTDDKAMAAIWIANLIRLKQEGFVPNRDLIVALTADEEGGDHNGARFLLEHHRDLIDASLCINEGGSGQMTQGRKLANNVQLSEKMFLSFRLNATSGGGHSSRPGRDNAIYALSRALVRISNHRFPARLDEITRTYFERMARIETGALSSDLQAIARRSDPDAVARLSVSPYYNAILRTTCVATELFGGHAENALPQRAGATINCRLLPGSDPDEVLDTLEAVVDDSSIVLVPLQEVRPSPPSRLDPEVLEAIERATESMWPGIPVVPTMGTAATDGLHLRNAAIPTFGVSGIFSEIDDARAHGKDERVRVEAFFEGQEFLYRLTKILSSGAGSTVSQ